MAKFCSKDGKFCSEDGKLCIEAPIGIYLGNASVINADGFIKTSLAGVELESVVASETVHIDIRRFDAYLGHQNYFATPAVTKVNLVTLQPEWGWRYDEHEADITITSISADDGTVYVAMKPSPVVFDLYALDTSNGTERWSIDAASATVFGVKKSNPGGVFVNYDGIVPIETRLHLLNELTGFLIQTLDQSLFQPTIGAAIVMGFDVIEADGSVLLILAGNTSTGSNIPLWIARVNKDLDTLISGPNSLGTIDNLVSLPMKFKVDQRSMNAWLVDDTPTAPIVRRFNWSTLAVTGPKTMTMPEFSGAADEMVISGDDTIIMIDNSARLYEYNIDTETGVVLSTISGSPVLTAMDIIRVEDIV